MLTAIIQARMGSSRLPGKVLMKIHNRSILELILARLSKSRKIDKIIVATSEKVIDDPISQEVKSLGYKIYRGSELDVLSRFYEASIKYKSSHIVRITADCPIVDPVLVDNVIYAREINNSDYASNIAPRSFPDGLDVEVFSFRALERAHRNSVRDSDREHVTPYIRRDKEMSQFNYSNSVDFSGWRWTLDTPEDLIVIKNIFNYFQPVIDFSWEEVSDLNSKHPELFSNNMDIKRSEVIK